MNRLSPDLFINLAEPIVYLLQNLQDHQGLTNLSFPHFFRLSTKENLGQISLSGETISLHLLCCGGLAVVNHSCVLHAVFLQQPRFVNKSG
jgi:hypothetical protein